MKCIGFFVEILQGFFLVVIIFYVQLYFFWIKSFKSCMSFTILIC